MQSAELDRTLMARALELARRGQGHVEPNPMVGCVIARGSEVVSEGWHQRFGGPHAEIEALKMAGHHARGATMYVTLEPCCHEGKTPPCATAIIDAGIRRVVAAMRDPFPKVAGGGFAALQSAGIEVTHDLLGNAARWLNAPYLKLLEHKRPWMIAKWAMTLDGKIATRSGDSHWISGDAARRIVHQLRGRVDAILVGRGTAEADDPQLTVRPPGPRVPLRIVADSLGRLSLQSQLVQSAREMPLLVAVGPQAPADACQRLTEAGCDVFVCPGRTHAQRIDQLLAHLAERETPLTNVLVEGGGKLLGSLRDAHAIDEVHVFIATKLFGGARATTPLAGRGVEHVSQALSLIDPVWSTAGDDLYMHGRVRHANEQ